MLKKSFAAQNLGGECVPCAPPINPSLEMVNPLKGFENTLKILHLSVRTLLRTVWTVWTQRVTWDRIFRWTSGKLTFIFKKKFYWWSYTINENLQNYMHTYYYPFVLNRIFCIRTKSNIYKEYNLIFFFMFPHMIPHSL